MHTPELSSFLRQCKSDWVKFIIYNASIKFDIFFIFSLRDCRFKHINTMSPKNSPCKRRTAWNNGKDLHGGTSWTAFSEAAQDCNPVSDAQRDRNSFDFDFVSNRPRFLHSKILTVRPWMVDWRQQVGIRSTYVWREDGTPNTAIRFTNRPTTSCRQAHFTTICRRFPPLLWTWRITSVLFSRPRTQSTPLYLLNFVSAMMYVCQSHEVDEDWFAFLTAIQWDCYCNPTGSCASRAQHCKMYVPPNLARTAFHDDVIFSCVQQPSQPGHPRGCRSRRKTVETQAIPWGKMYDYE